ncbi:glucocorticoid modulatory element-binding protein 1, partial [Engraulis encrasicolus]|uniref:glucocorticoid modulatory element-binding protein 1 n=1 Tax=Engraulis encrasicolus TaxID=184585 RepID=UPI002FCF39D8
MAETEVTVSMGDMVVVKTTEQDDDGESDSKTQVILQLQPITHTQGLGEDGEAETAVVAVEAQEATLDGEEVELGYPITCGESKAVLIMKKFVCPGINVKCVKYGDQLISPKQFVHMAGKATLKDWKRAIRIGGVMLRKMMDSGQLDFYQHGTLCTNTCRSTKFDLLISNTRFPPDGTLLATPTSASGEHTCLLATPTSATATVDNGIVLERVEEGDVTTVTTASVEWNTASSLENAIKKENQEISEETLSFWKGIAEVGLMGEVVTNIKTELLEMLKGVQVHTDHTSLLDSEVAVLSNLVQVFGLLDSIKKILNEKRLQTDPSQEQHNTLTSLELQLEEQRKQQAQSWLALNSSMVTPMPTPAPTPTSSKRAPKRPRLQRPASTTTLLTSPSTPTGGSVTPQPHLTLHPQQFTVLSPITLTSVGHQPFSSVGQPFTVANLPLATLAQPANTLTLHTLPGGSQIFTRYTGGGTTATGAGLVATATTALDGSKAGQQETITLHSTSGGETITLHPTSSGGLTLVGTAAIQDSGHMGATVVSPMELVQLAQGALGGGAEGVMVSASTGAAGAEVMEGAMLVQQDLGEVTIAGVGGEEEEEENQEGHATVIEIDPAPGEGETQTHAVGVMQLQLAEEQEEANGTGGEITTMVIGGAGG